VGAECSRLTIGLRRIFGPLAALAGLVLSALSVTRTNRWLAMNILERPTSRRQNEFLTAAKRSRRLHQSWVTAPQTAQAFKAYFQRLRTGTYLSYWVITEDRALGGVINVSEIVRGAFCSGYLGYYTFVPHHGKGYMSRGLAAVLQDCFRIRGLHRVEANIQPGNDYSRILVQRHGFRLEGFSPRYLKIAGRWRDHERWDAYGEDWRRDAR
jgi:ribosomal-protein-alanine N-acetyltransferase